MNVLAIGFTNPSGLHGDWSPIRQWWRRGWWKLVKVQPTWQGLPFTPWHQDAFSTLVNISFCCTQAPSSITYVSLKKGCHMYRAPEDHEDFITPSLTTAWWVRRCPTSLSPGGDKAQLGHTLPAGLLWDRVSLALHRNLPDGISSLGLPFFLVLFFLPPLLTDSSWGCIPINHFYKNCNLKIQGVVSIFPHKKTCHVFSGNIT